VELGITVRIVTVHKSVKNKPNPTINRPNPRITGCGNNGVFSPSNSETGDQSVDRTLGTGPPDSLIMNRKCKPSDVRKCVQQ